MPIAEGFDHSYYLKDQGRFFNPTRHWKDDIQLPPVEKGTDYYATTALADHAVEVLSEHEQQHAETPFSHYLAFFAPHFPLHALPEGIAVYEDTYTAGWDAIRARRWQRIQQIDIPATLLDLAGAKTLSGAPNAPGKSLVPVFSNHDRAGRNTIWWFHDGNKAIRMGDWKLIKFYTPGKDVELYNLKEDIGETNNLAAQRPRLVIDMSLRLEQHLKDIEARLPTINPKAK